MSTGPNSRWLAFPGLVVAAVIPLLLCLVGALDIAALIFTYALETAIVTVIVDLEPSGWHSVRIKLGALLVIGLCAIGAAARMTWTPTYIASIVVVLVAGFAGMWWNARERGTPLATSGGFAWRLAVVGMGLIGLTAASDYEELVDHGWTPSGTDSWLSPLSVQFVRAAVALEVDPLVIPTVVLVLFKSLNEVLYELYTLLRDDYRAQHPGGLHAGSEA